MSDKQTCRILTRLGVQAVSDALDASARQPLLLPEGIVSLPINVLPDHNHIYHAERTPERIVRETPPGNFSYGSMAIGEWYDIVEAQIHEIHADGGIATVLVHPICMHISDDFHIFERICRLAAQLGTIWTSEAITLVSQ